MRPSVARLGWAGPKDLTLGTDICQPESESERGYVANIIPNRANIPPPSINLPGHSELGPMPRKASPSRAPQCSVRGP